MQTINGVMTALITPFKNNKIDSNSYEKIIKRQIKNNVGAIVPAGTTGECVSLNLKEHMECIEIALNLCKNTNTKVLAGIGAGNIQRVIELAKFSQDKGANGILCLAPYYSKPNQEGLYKYFLEIASSVEIPIILYDIPSRTNINIEISTIQRLIKDSNNIQGIKEASGNMERIIELNAKIQGFKVIGGADIINYSILSSGGVGVISVTSNLLPNRILNLVEYAAKGNFKESLRENCELFDLNKALFCETNPIPIKTAMWLCGLIDSLEFRLPLDRMSKQNLSLLENTLKKYEVIQ